MNAQLIKARPVGRASLGEAIATLAGHAHDLRWQFEWIASDLDLERFDQAQRDYYNDLLLVMNSAREDLLALAIAVKLGHYPVREPRSEAGRSPVPLLDLIEQGNGQVAVEPEDEVIDGGEIVHLEPEPDPPYKTFEVLDRGPKKPGHVQFDAPDAAKAVAHAAESFPGLEVREVTEDSQKVKNAKGSDGQPKGRNGKPASASASVREPVVKGSEVKPIEPLSATELGEDDDLHDALPLQRETKPDGRKRWVALNAMKRPVVFCRAFTRAGAQAVVDRVKPNAVLDLVEDLDNIGALTTLPELVAREQDEFPFDIEEPEPEPPISPVEALDTDDLLLLALNRRSGMPERWEALQRDGASDLEMRAAISRAFDQGEIRIGTWTGRGGSIESRGGNCSFQSGESPKFWAGPVLFDGRPTLEGKRLIERARAVLEIPVEAGGKPPSRKTAKARRKLG